MMLQRFKLRLGDGTVLLVDHDGLGTWLVDGKASVQAGKSRKWIPLRKFLASERASAARRARTEASAWAALPADSRGAKRGDKLPLVPPPPGDETPPPGSPAPRADGLPLVPPPEPHLEPRKEGPSPREDGLPLVPPPPPGDASAPAIEVEPAQDELSLALPSLPEEAPPPVVPLAVPLAEDLTVASPALPAEEVAIAPALIEPEAILPPVTFVEETPPGPEAPPSVEDEPVVRITVGEPRVVQRAADEPAPPTSEPLFDAPSENDSLALSAGPWSAPEEPPPSLEPHVMEPQVMEPQVRWAARSDFSEPHEIQALADEPVESNATPVGIRDLPVIPLKPLQEAPPVPLAGESVGLGGTRARVAWPQDDHRGTSPSGRSGEALPEPRSRADSQPRSRLALFEGDGPFSAASVKLGKAIAAQGVIASFGGFLSRLLDPVNRLERGLPLFPVEPASEGGPAPGMPRQNSVPVMPRSGEIGQVLPLADEPSMDPEGGGGQKASGEALPVIRLKPLDGPLWDPARGRRLLARARLWIERPASWVRGLTVPSRGVPTPEPFSEPETPRASEPTPPRALDAPPAIAELPVLRFAPAGEPDVVEDVYGGEQSEAFIPVAWLWAKRLTIAVALLAGATVAAMTFEAWSPRAAQIGETTLLEIDGRVRSHHLAAQRQEAVAEVTAQLPQLDPETIGLLMARSPNGLLNAAGVFEMACDSADRGLLELASSEAQELETLQQGLLDGLLSAERERIRDFDLARERGAVFPVDGQQALRAYARGARQLAPASQERLKWLLGRAIAAALQPGKATAASAVPR